MHFHFKKRFNWICLKETRDTDFYLLVHSQGAFNSWASPRLKPAGTGVRGPPSAAF